MGNPIHDLTSMTSTSRVTLVLQILLVIIIPIYGDQISNLEVALDASSHYPQQFKSQPFHSTSITNTFNLVITPGRVSPDGFPQDGILINDQFPGPTLRVNQHERLIVHIWNGLPSGITIHFHGIHMTGTISSDGVPGVTQYLIAPNSSYTYHMSPGSQSGTFMYHAHSGLDQNWIVGPLIIQEHPLMYFDPTQRDFNLDLSHERILLLTQLFHTLLSRILEGLMASPFQDFPDTDSILINGKSWGNWSSNENEIQGEGYEVIRVRPGDLYRFRIIGFGMDSMLRMEVQNHSMKVIEADGILISSVVTDHLIFDSAQRYSVLIRMDQPIGNYLIRVQMVPGPGPKNGIAILHYEGADDPSQLRRIIHDGLTEELELDSLILPKLHPNLKIHQPVIYPLPVTFDRQLIIRTTQKVVQGGYTKFEVNGVLDWDPARDDETLVPLLAQIRTGINVTREPQVFEVPLGTRLQIIFQNTVSEEDGELMCEPHPWHVHGHTFWVVGSGDNEFNSSKDQVIINANVQKGQLQFRDVVTVFPTQGRNWTIPGEGCGWTGVRFVANNPGIWMIHCHLTAHMIMGKKFVIWVHSSADPKLLEVS